MSPPYAGILGTLAGYPVLIVIWPWVRRSGKTSMRTATRGSLSPCLASDEPGAGSYRRDTGDGEHVEITMGERVYRVRRAERRPG